MKKFLALMLITSAFFSVSALAQDQDNKGGRAGIAKQLLIDSLNLSETAADSVVAVTQRSMIHIRDIMKDESLSQDEKREKIKPLREEMRTHLKQYLTDEQMAKLRQIEMERRQNRK
jgi:hypothetical protein